jgi:6-pyruvoyltetrahydropterin/6-carboxytetrahydropterin synthase
MLFRIKKRYDHTEGLSATFRQFRAPETHCSKVHGYALAVELEFESPTLDYRNWVISFGELKEVKAWLKEQFDHKTLISINDPELAYFQDGHDRGVLQLEVVEEVGCEMFAKLIYENVVRILRDSLLMSDVLLTRVTVAEHGGNSASYELNENDFIDLLTDIDDQPTMSDRVSDSVLDELFAAMAPKAESEQFVKSSTKYDDETAPFEMKYTGMDTFIAGNNNLSFRKAG